MPGTGSLTQDSWSRRRKVGVGLSFGPPLRPYECEEQVELKPVNVTRASWRRLPLEEKPGKDEQQG